MWFVAEEHGDLSGNCVQPDSPMTAHAFSGTDLIHIRQKKISIHFFFFLNGHLSEVVFPLPKIKVVFHTIVKKIRLSSFFNKIKVVLHLKWGRPPFSKKNEIVFHISPNWVVMVLLTKNQLPSLLREKFRSSYIYKKLRRVVQLIALSTPTRVIHPSINHITITYLVLS